jgi:hypothetical protein
MSKKGASKFSDDKAQFSLLPIKALYEVLKVGKMGAKKYGDNNFRKGRNVTDWTDAAYRHAFGGESFSTGHDLDKESLMPHLAHAAWNLLVALEQQMEKPELDNRAYKGKKK